MSNAHGQLSAAERRRLSRQVRDAFPPMGIYVVRDQASGQIWLGSSRDVYAVLNRIQFQLRLGVHTDKVLQEKWSSDPTRFSFEVLDLVKERSDPDFDYQEELRTLLQFYRDELGVSNSP